MAFFHPEIPAAAQLFWTALPPYVTRAANPLSSDPAHHGERPVQQRLEKEWELSIDPDTVRLFILKAKALSAAVNAWASAEVSLVKVVL